MLIYGLSEDRQVFDLYTDQVEAESRCSMSSRTIPKWRSA